MASAHGVLVSPVEWEAANASGSSVTAFLFDASTKKIEWFTTIEEGCTVTHVGFPIGALTGTAPTLRLSVQTPVLTTAARADGVVLASGNFQATATGWLWVALGTPLAVTRGQRVAFVIDYVSGTADASNSVSVTVRYTNSGNSYTDVVITETAGTPSRAAGPIPVGYKSATKCYGNTIRAFDSTDFGLNTALNTTTWQGDEKGTKFTLPAGWGDTYKVVGIRANCRFAVGRVITIKLYDTDGSTVLQSTGFDTDQVAVGSASNVWAFIYFDEATLATLTYGNTYRITFTPDDDTAMRLSLGLLAAAEGSPAENTAYADGVFHLTFRADAGAWNDDSRVVPFVSLILSDITEPVGGGAAGGAHIFGGTVVR